jgi:hypothetical protein
MWLADDTLGAQPNGSGLVEASVVVVAIIVVAVVAAADVVDEEVAV